MTASNKPNITWMYSVELFTLENADYPEWMNNKTCLHQWNDDYDKWKDVKNILLMCWSKICRKTDYWKMFKEVWLIHAICNHRKVCWVSNGSKMSEAFYYWLYTAHFLKFGRWLTTIVKFWICIIECLYWEYWRHYETVLSTDGMEDMYLVHVYIKLPGFTYQISLICYLAKDWSCASGWEKQIKRSESELQRTSYPASNVRQIYESLVENDYGYPFTACASVSPVVELPDWSCAKLTEISPKL